MLLLVAILLPRLYQVGVVHHRRRRPLAAQLGQFLLRPGAARPGQHLPIAPPRRDRDVGRHGRLLVTFPEYRGMGQGYFNDDEYNQFIRAQGIPRWIS